MRNGLGAGILALIKVCLLLVLISRAVRSYPSQVGDESVSSESSESSESVMQNEQPELRLHRRWTQNTSGSGWSTSSKRTIDHDEASRVTENALQDKDSVAWSANRDRSRVVNTNAPRQQRPQHSHSFTASGSGGQGQRLHADNERAASTQDVVLSDDAIVFPTDNPMPNRTKFNLKDVPSCQGSTFCETVPNYPESLLNDVIRANESIKYLGVIDEVPDVIQRIDVADDDVLLCLSNEQIVYPKTAENKQKEWLFIANQKDIKQGVRIETCVNENSECNVVTGLAEGYVMTCKQKYIYRQLIAIRENNTLAPEMFRFPSSCCCHAKFTGNALTRIGLGSWTKNPVTPVRTRRRK